MRLGKNGCTDTIGAGREGRGGILDIKSRGSSKQKEGVCSNSKGDGAGGKGGVIIKTNWLTWRESFNACALVPRAAPHRFFGVGRGRKVIKRKRS